VSKDLLAIIRKLPLPLPPQQEDFFAIIRDKGFEPAYKIFKEVESLDPDYKSFEAFEITVLADELFKAGREDDAIKAAKLRVEAYPNDYLSFEWVANLYYKKKDWGNALRYYTSAYEMAQNKQKTPQLLDELEWYRKRIRAVQDNLGGVNQGLVR
jgi:tetratricopeptide (TPR) repeat protein